MNKKITQKELDELIRLHALWLGFSRGGRQLNLSNYDLVGMNLAGSTLSYANLQGANLEGANLEDVNLLGANLEDANLTNVNLRLVNINNTCIKHIEMPIDDMYFHKSDKYSKGHILNIGCKSRSIQYWLENCIDIGWVNNYPYELVKEYRKAIKSLESEL